MKLYPTTIPDVKLFEPARFEDARGYFFESYNYNKLAEIGILDQFVQDNQSRSTRGVLRGIHFQLGEAAQSKLVRVLEGEVLDVAVDLRRNSPTFGKWFSAKLSADNGLQMYIPRGFGHGFAVLSPFATFFYKCDNFYSPKNEGGIAFDCPELNIDWQLQSAEILLSAKDRILPKLSEAEELF